MANISKKSWLRYIERLRKLSDKASDSVKQYVVDNGGLADIDRQKLIEYAYGVATKYGEGAASLSAEMYEAMAMRSGKRVKAAITADTPTVKEVATTVNGILKRSHNEDMLSAGVGRLVKRTGVDTVMNNALRDGAEWAWIPHGDTCAFCLTLASQGWVKASKKAVKNGHAEHIHANCDCTYAVRFDHDLQVEGYDPEVYKAIYDNAEGRTSDDKINSIRRMRYAEHKDMINAQKRAAYAERNMKYSLSDNEGAFHTIDERRNEDRKSIIKPHNVISNLMSTETGKEALSLIEQNKTLVELCYGRDNKNSLGQTIMGMYNPFENKIYVYADSTKTIMETAKTVVHEAFHLSDYGMCQKSEVYCMMKEKLHEKGDVPLTKDEINGIIRIVRRLYPKLPWEV